MFIITDPAEQNWEMLPQMASQCCGAPALNELDIGEHGAMGRCSRCKEGAMFDNTCSECGSPLSDGEEDKCAQCSAIAYTGGV